MVSSRWIMRINAMVVPAKIVALEDHGVVLPSMIGES